MFTPQRLKAALIAGLIVGTVDITAACVTAYLQKQVPPAAVFRFVASGAFGPDAFTGGAGIAAAGLFFHYLIALSWTALFFFAYSKLPEWRQNFAVGLVYGLFVWIVMTFVVVPLSRVPARPFNVQSQMIQLFIHTVLIGGTIAYLTNRYYASEA